MNVPTLNVDSLSGTPDTVASDHKAPVDGSERVVNSQMLSPRTRASTARVHHPAPRSDIQVASVPRSIPSRKPLVTAYRRASVAVNGDDIQSRSRSNTPPSGSPKNSLVRVKQGGFEARKLGKLNKLLSMSHGSLHDYMRPAAKSPRASPKPPDDNTILFSIPEIPPNDIHYEESHVLGAGAYGVVYRGTCRKHDVAVKVLSSELQDLPHKLLIQFRKEVAIMSKLFHPNITLFMGACTVPGKLMIVVELMETDLRHYLDENIGHIPLVSRMKMAKDVALGMNWLHHSTPPIIHHDLKLQNLLIRDGQVKVSDLGLSVMVRSGKKARIRKTGEHHAIGTPLYMAPEKFGSDVSHITEKVDVYAFGMILWELFTMKKAFDKETNIDGNEETKYELFRRMIVEERRRPSFPAKALPTLRSLIEECWAHDYTTRPGFDEVIERLEDVIADVAIPDLIACNFWKTLFRKKERVPWDSLFVPFCQTLKLPFDQNVKPNSACFKEVVADQVTDVYTVDSVWFGNIVSLFGPIKVPPEKGNSLLDRVRILMQMPWFHGRISDNQAHTLLKGKSVGTFLARFGGAPLSYELIVMGDNRYRHITMSVQPGESLIPIVESSRWREKLELVTPLAKSEVKSDNLVIEYAEFSTSEVLTPRTPTYSRSRQLFSPS